MNDRHEEWRKTFESKELRSGMDNTEYIKYNFEETNTERIRKLEIHLSGCSTIPNNNITNFLCN